MWSSMPGVALQLRRWHTGAVASSRPGVTVRMYPMTQVVSRRCAVLVARCFSIASTVQCHGLVSARRCSSSARGAPCCVVSPLAMCCLCVVLLYFSLLCPCTSGSLEPYLVLGCKAYRQQMNTIQVGRISSPPGDIQKKKAWRASRMAVPTAISTTLHRGLFKLPRSL